MLVYFSQIIRKLRNSRFFKDSFWAVFGNGIGYGLMLLAGIIIARLLGKELYGEYGFVKSTMFQFAAFSTLGLGYTSTKFVAEYKSKDASQVKPIINASIKITTIASCIIALLIIFFAKPLASYLNQPSMSLALQILGFIVIIRALNTTQFGVLAGFGNFKIIAKINGISGVTLFALSIPLTFFFSLEGSLAALAVSQIICVLLNHSAINRFYQTLPLAANTKYVWKLTRFSLPVAMQELTYALSQWLGVFIITKCSSFGEVGLYTASTIWTAVIMIIPSFLSDVILSHLSACTNDTIAQNRKIKQMLLVNFMCTAVPFIFIFLFSPFIVSLYGTSFNGLSSVLRVISLSTIFMCCSNVFGSELIAQGYTWTLFLFRGARDILTVIVGFMLIRCHQGINAAQEYSWSIVFFSFLFFLALAIYCRFKITKVHITRKYVSD